MPNLQQAPTLKAEGKKLQGNAFWQYDPDLLCYIQKETGRAHSQFALMLYLMGNQPGWSCSTADICNRTGIADRSSLSRVKKALKDRGWIDYEEGKHITVLYDEIYKKIKGCSENNAQGCSENNAQGCSENNHNNINNIIKNTIKGPFLLPAVEENVLQGPKAEEKEGFRF